MIKHKLIGLINKIIEKHCSKANPNYFYGCFLGGSKGIINNSIFIMFRKKRIYKISKFAFYDFFNKLFKKKHHNNIMSLNDIETKYLKDLKRDGVVIINNFFEKSDMDHISKFHPNYLSQENLAYTEYNRYKLSNIDHKTLTTLLNVSLLKVISYYNECETFIVSHPILNITVNNSNDTTSRYFHALGGVASIGFADVWHTDRPNMIKFHVLLSDTSMNDPHMIYAKSSHLSILRTMTHQFYSEEYVNDHFQVIHCIGKKGTVYLFDGSRGIHRLKKSIQGKRVTLEVNFTKEAPSTACRIENNEKISWFKFSEFQKSFLKHER